MIKAILFLGMPSYSAKNSDVVLTGICDAGAMLGLLLLEEEDLFS